MKSKLPDYYESNLLLLKKHHFHVWNIVSELDLAPLGEIVLSKGGQPNLKFVNEAGEAIFFHDEDEPGSEVTQYLEIVPESACGLVVLFGMGLGHVLRELLRQRSEMRYLAVFELEPRLFVQALRLTDLTSVLSDPRLLLAVSPYPEIGQILEPARFAMQLEDVYHLNHLPSFFCNQESYRKLSEQVIAHISDQSNIGTTQLNHGKTFIEKRFSNLSSFHHNHLLEGLKDVFSGVPAILVSAGPSLDENIHLISGAVGKAVIFAIDSALPALLANNVTPDFVTSIDPTAFEKIADVAQITRGVSLICKPWVDPQVPKAFPADNIFWSLGGGAIGEWLNTLLGGSSVDHGASTVAHMNLIAAINLGCSPIIFVGQDLSYGSGKSHTQHAVWALDDGDESILEVYDKYIQVDGIHGHKVPTIRLFESFRKTFEEIIKTGPKDCRYINATAQGAHINGTEVMALEKVINSFCLNDMAFSSRLDARLKELKRPGLARIVSGLSRMENIIKKLKKIAKKAERLAGTVRGKIKKLEKKGASFHSFAEIPGQIQKRTTELEACNRELDGADTIWLLLEDLTLEGFRQSERMMLSISRLSNDTERYMEWFLKSLERHEYINGVRFNALNEFHQKVSVAVARLGKENKIIKRIRAGGKKNDLFMDLVDLYFQSGDYVLAKKIIEEDLNLMPDSGRICYYSGCIAAVQAEYDSCDIFFNRALQLDPGLGKKIRKFRRDYADKLFKYAEAYRNIGRATFQKALIKALRLDNENSVIKKELETLETQKQIKEDLCPVETKMSGFPDYYESNLLFLKKYHFHTWEIITESGFVPFGEIVISPQGKPGLEVLNGEGETVFFHDEDASGDEGPKYLDSIPETHTGIVVLFGVGLGYTLLELFNTRPNVRHIFAFELEPRIFMQALRYTDFAPVLSDFRLILSVGADPDVIKILEPAVHAMMLEDTYYVRQGYSFSYDNSSYEQLAEKVTAHINEYANQGKTMLSNGRLLFDNRFSNLSSIHHNFLLEDLKDLYSGIPAVIVAAGPSLDMNIQHLAGIKGKAVIISIDSALPALLANNVIPDFVTSIDPTAFEKIADSAPIAKGISLICTTWVDPEVPKAFPADNIFWSFLGVPMDKWLNTIFGGKAYHKKAWTVAHQNLTSAITMGCSPIIFVGQDLAYGTGKSHTKHAVWAMDDGDEAVSEIYQDIILIDGINGDKVPSIRLFDNFLKIFQEIITDNPDRCYINSTARGAHIGGTKNIPLEVAVSSYCSGVNDVEGRLRELVTSIEHPSFKRIISELHKMSHRVKKIRVVSGRAERLAYDVRVKLEKYEKEGTSFHSVGDIPYPIKKYMGELDSLHDKLDKEVGICGLVEELTMEGARQSECMDHSIKMLSEDSSKYNTWLCKSLERHEYVNRVRSEAFDQFINYLCLSANHLQKEEQINKTIINNGRTTESLMELVDLYFQTGDYVLAKPIVNELLKKMPDTAEIYYYSGCISVMQAEYAKFDFCFDRALQLDPGLADKIRGFRRGYADKLFKYGEDYRNIGRATFKTALLKGFCIDNEHPAIKEELGKMAKEDLEKIELDMAADGGEYRDSLLLSWCRDLDADKHLLSSLPPDFIAGFYKARGSLLFTEKDLANSALSFEKALGFTPESPDIHATLTQIYFDMGDYPKGIVHLNKAVELDKKYAVYWENIGDHLYESGQNDDALLAYERCFTALPENISALKKMGDCYMVMGHHGAAQEVCRQLKKRLPARE